MAEKVKYDPLTMPRELPLKLFQKISVDDRIAWGLIINVENPKSCPAHQIRGAQIYMALRKIK